MGENTGEQTDHLVGLVKLHLYPPERGFALLALDVLRIAVELVADAVDDLLEVGFVRVEEGRGGAVHRCCRPVRLGVISRKRESDEEGRGV